MCELGIIWQNVKANYLFLQRPDAITDRKIKLISIIVGMVELRSTLYLLHYIIHFYIPFIFYFFETELHVAQTGLRFTI